MILPFKNGWENMTTSSIADDSVSAHDSGVFPRALFNCYHVHSSVQIYFKEEIQDKFSILYSHVNNLICGLFNIRFFL